MSQIVRCPSRDWCSGNIKDSKPLAIGSIPVSRVNLFEGSSFPSVWWCIMLVHQQRGPQRLRATAPTQEGLVPMTSETLPTNTLKFPFGETPEEVIRRKFEGSDSQLLIMASHRSVDPPVECDLNADDLLTVLDALSRTSPEGSAGFNLRIQILAALGIDESEGGE